MLDRFDPSHPLADFLGLELDVPAVDRAEARLELDDRHHNPNGVLHGAVPFAMVDVAMGAATLSGLQEGQTCASTDVHLRFLRSATEGRVEASVEVTHRGRRTVTLHGEVTCDGRLIATATGAFVVLDPR